MSQRVDEDTFEDLFEHAPCGYILTSPDGVIARVNRTFLEWTAYSRDDLIGQKVLLDLLPVPGKILYETHYLPLLHMQGYVNEIAFDLICGDGRRLPVVLNTVQKRAADGTALQNRTTIFNSTQRRQYEREIQFARRKAEQALRLRDQFLSVASHELKTPLTAILGNIQMLRRRMAPASERDQRTFDIIIEQARRINQMILSLLDTSRIETGQLSIVRTLVNVLTLVTRVVDESRSVLGDRTIIVETVTIHEPLVQGDELRLEQVFRNLVQNALKYSAADAPVYVRIRQYPAQIEVAIVDRGIGIPSTALPHLFDRYYRATNANNGGISGMGIGLYVVKEIVELHGGQVYVESTEGQGSTFTVHLPAAGAR